MKKKIYITLFMLFIFVLSSQAQIGEQRHNFSVGVNGGMTFNSVSFQPTIKQNSYPGITLGLTARYVSEKYFNMICGAQLELNYVKLGWNEKNDDNMVGNYKRSMDYVQIPFLAHLAFGKDKGIQVFFNLGPQIGFLLSEKETFSSDFSVNNRSVVTQYGKMADKKFDYGITGGLGMELRTGAGNFLLEGRYYYGLGDFYNTTKKDYFSRAANMTIYAKITYLFDLSK